MVKYLPSLAAALLAMTACEFDRTVLPSPEDRVVVHSVLNPQAVEQVVLVEHTLTGRIAIDDSTRFDPLDPVVSGGGEPISGARVMISNEAGDSAVAVEDVTARADGKGRGVYRIRNGGLDAMSFVQGGRYRLRVVTPDNRTVTGYTRIPSVARNTDTTMDFNRDRDTLRLRWTDAQGGRTYSIRLDTPFGAFFLFSDSTRFDLTGDLRNFFTSNLPSAFIPGFRQHVVVAAVDSNFFDYYRSRNDPFSGSGIINHLSGGFGFFGSLTPIERRTIDVTQDRRRPVEGVYDANLGTSSRMGLDLYVEQENRGVEALSAYMWFPPAGTPSTGWRRAGAIGHALDGRITLAVLGPTNVVTDTADVFTGTFAGDSIYGSFGDGAAVVFRRRTGP